MKEQAGFQLELEGRSLSAGLLGRPWEACIWLTLLYQLLQPRFLPVCSRKDSTASSCGLYAQHLGPGPSTEEAQHQAGVVNTPECRDPRLGNTLVPGQVYSVLSLPGLISDYPVVAGTRNLVTLMGRYGAWVPAAAASSQPRTSLPKRSL